MIFSASPSTSKLLLITCFLLLAVVCKSQDDPAFSFGLPGKAMIVSFDMSADGRLMAFAGSDNTIKIMSLSSKKEIFAETFPAKVKLLKISPDGNYLAIAGTKDTLYIYHVKDLTKKRRIIIPRNSFDYQTMPYIRWISITNNNKLLIAASTGKTYTTALGTYSDLEKLFPELVDISMTYMEQIAPGRDLFLISEQDGYAIRNLTGGGLVRRFKIENDYGENHCLGISRSGRYLIRGWKNGVIQYYNIQTGEPVKSFEFTSKDRYYKIAVNSLSFSSEDKLITGGFSDGTARIYESATGKELHRYKGDAGCKSFFCLDDKYIAVCTRNQVSVYKTSTATISRDDELNTLHKENQETLLKQTGGQNTAALTNQPKLTIPYGHQNGISFTAFSQDNRLMVTADDENSIIWDVRSGKPLHYLTGGKPVFNATGEYVATIDNKRVLIWNVNNGSLFRALIHENIVISTSFNPAKNYIIVSTRPPGITDQEGPITPVLWNYASGEQQKAFNPGLMQKNNRQADCIRCYDEGSCPVYGAAFDETGTHIIVVFHKAIRTYDFGNYTSYQTVCFPRGYEREFAASFLEHGVIMFHNSEGSSHSFLDMKGNLLKNVSYDKLPFNMKMFREAIAVSPAKNYVAMYDARQVRLIGLKQNADLGLAIKNVQKLYFNTAGTHLLVQQLGAVPVIYDLTRQVRETHVTDQIAAGFPRSLFVVKTDTTHTLKNVGSELYNKTLPDSMKQQLPAFMLKMVDELLQAQTTTMNHNMLSSHSNSGYIEDLRTGRTISMIKSSVLKPGDIQISKDNTILFYRAGGVLYLYSIPRARLIATFEAKYIKAYLSPDGRTLVLIRTKTRAISLISTTTGRVYVENTIPNLYTEHSITFLPDGQSFVLLQNHINGGYQRISMATGALLEEKKQILSCAFTPDGQYRGYVYTKGIVGIYDTRSGAQLVSAKGANILFASNSKSVVIWSPDSITYIPDISDPKNGKHVESVGQMKCEHILISPGGQYLYVQTEGIGNIFNLKTMKFVASFNLHYTKPFVFNNFGSGIKDILDINDEVTTKYVHPPLLARFSATGDSLITNNDGMITILRCKDGKPLKVLNTYGDIKYFSLINDLVISFFHGQIKFYSISKTREWFTLVAFENGNAAFILPDGKYYGAKEIIRQIGYVAESRSFSFKQFDLENNRPDLVLTELGCTDQCLLNMLKASHEMRIQRTGQRSVKQTAQTSIPQVLIANEKDIKGEAFTDKLPVKLRFTDDRTTLKNFSIWVNGNPLYDKNGITIPAGRNNYDTAIMVPLSQGKNFIELSVFNVNNIESFRFPLFVNYVPEKEAQPNVYFIGLGAGEYKQDNGTDSFNLHWAVKDIRDVAHLLDKYFRGRFFLDTLMNKEVSVENLAGLKSRLKNTKVDDMVIIYYAGHGLLDMAKAETFFGTYDMNFSAPAQKGISFDDFKNILAGIPARKKAIFLDACHSGELNKQAWQKNKICSSPPPVNVPQSTSVDTLDELAKTALSQSPKNRGNDPADLSINEQDPFRMMLQLFTDIDQRDGSYVIAAAEGLEKAQEDTKLQNGVFTHSLLKGITMRTADLNKDSAISIDELKNYVIEDVKRSSLNSQQPIARQENADYDWKLFEMPNTRDIPSPADENPFRKVDVETPDTINNKPGGTVSSEAGLLVSDSVMEVRYRINNGKLILIFNSPYYIPGFNIDVNQNKVIDSCIDKGYGLMSNSNTLCPNMMITATSSTYCWGNARCNAPRSLATLSVSGSAYTFTIPVSELTNVTNSSEIWLQVKCYSNARGFRIYPVKRGKNYFDEVFKIKK